MSEFSVDVRDVSKRFRLAHGKHKSLKERVIHRASTSHEDFWALKDVSSRSRRARRSGSWAATARGSRPCSSASAACCSRRRARSRCGGSWPALLELGAGFQPDLTGRENIYLNGSLLGMTKREIDKVFDAIVDFSELERVHR